MKLTLNIKQSPTIDIFPKEKKRRKIINIPTLSIEEKQ